MADRDELLARLRALGRLVPLDVASEDDLRRYGEAVAVLTELRTVCDATCIGPILDAVADDDGEGLFDEAVALLTPLDRDDLRGPVLAALDAPHPGTRALATAVAAVRLRDDAGVVAALTDRLADGSARVRREAVLGLRTAGGAALAAVTRAASLDPDVAVRTAAATALRERERADVPTLRALGVRDLVAGVPAADGEPDRVDLLDVRTVPEDADVAGLRAWLVQQQHRILADLADRYVLTADEAPNDVVNRVLVLDLRRTRLQHDEAVDVVREVLAAAGHHLSGTSPWDAVATMTVDGDTITTPTRLA